jgi:hypothetical protein
LSFFFVKITSVLFFAEEDSPAKSAKKSEVPLHFPQKRKKIPLLQKMQEKSFPFSCTIGESQVSYKEAIVFAVKNSAMQYKKSSHYFTFIGF